MSSAKHLLKPIYINNGAIAIGHRLKTKVLPDIKAQGVTHVVTLISEKEGALAVKKAVEAAGINWLWLPLENAKPPASENDQSFRRVFSQWQALLEGGAYFYIHCAAGIHRTGMITYALLRYLTFDAVESHQYLESLRDVTSEQVGFERLKWGDFFAPGFTGKYKPGKLNLSDLLTMNLIGKTFYSHSVGEGYQYRGEVKKVKSDGSLVLTKVETACNESCDFDFTNPYSISGVWEPYEDIEYASTRVDIEASDKGLEITYAYAGTVYIHL
ncbi:protein-tyrosine phosphatase family protein [Aliikangiella marina]|uniref:protein-tyrosine phosphatase family protein n=1 Tax=Aliikangiella marina TaxID=1712262 RepID=UPI00163D61F7|nr:tyrosine-protein phosphatase [Aliikangiella marina]